MILIFAGIPIIGLLLYFAVGIRGLAGAIILGVSAVSADLLWQWLRITCDKRLGPKFLMIIILTGFLVRIASLICFLKIAEAGLTTHEVYLTAIILLCILFSQKILAITVSRKEDQPNAS
jgi:hypothetical protein